MADVSHAPQLDGRSIQDQPADRFRVSLLACFLLLSVSSVIPFTTAINGEFVWLDKTEIVDGGYRVQSLRDVRRVLTMSLDEYLDRDQSTFSTSGGYWRPIYAASISIDWLLWHDSHWCYHIENLLWHLATVTGLFWFSEKLLRDWLGIRAKDARLLALASSCLFACSPLNVHSVSWISGRKDLMCATFTLVSLNLLTNHFAVSHSKSSPAISKRMALALAFFVLAVGSKETALVLPLICFLMLLWSCSRSDETDVPDIARMLFRRSVPLVVVAIAYLILRFVLLGGIGSGAQYPSSSLLINIANAAMIFWHHVWRTLLPFSPSISDSWQLPQSVGLVHWIAIISTIVFYAITLWGLAKRTVWAFGLFWFSCWLLPVSGLLPLQHVTAERFLYPASWGLLLAFSFGLLSVTRRLKQPDWWAAIIFTLLITAFGFHTLMENRYWMNDDILFSHAVQKDASFAEGHLALSSIAIDAGNYQRAAHEARLAAEIGGNPVTFSYTSPFLASTYQGLANYHLKRFKQAENHFLEARAVRPNHATSEYHLGLVCLAQQRVEEASQHFQRALELNPRDSLCRGNLGHALLMQHRVDECVQVMRPLMNDQNVSEVDLGNFGTALLLTRDFEAARKVFNKLNRVRPNNAATLAKLAWANAALDSAAAREHLDRARGIDGSHPTVQYVEKLLD